MNISEQAILRAARVEFNRRGYKATTMADVAARSELAVGSLYKFYASKEELFFAVYFAENARVKGKIAAGIDWSEPRTALLEFITQAAQATQDSRILQAWYQPGIGEALRQECQNSCQASQFRQFLHTQVGLWRTEGKLTGEFSDEFLLEVLDVANALEAQLPASDAVKQLYLEAVVEKLFL